MKLTSILSLTGAVGLLGATLIYSLAGLTTIEPGEVGLQIQMVGLDRGMKEETLDTGLRWVDPIRYDVKVYDTRFRQETFSDVPSNTRDGQPITVDLSLQIGLLDSGVPQLHERIGPDYFDQVVLPAVRSSVRLRTATQDSDNIYTGDGRAAIQAGIQNDLKSKLEAFGINALVNLREITFTNNDFVEKLEEKARAAQQIEIETRNAAAEEQKAIKKANFADGEKQKRIKAAEANREELRLQGEGERLQKQEAAIGILAVATAEAEGIRLKQEAVSGPGGKTYASIVWAQHLGPNVKVLGYPLGAPGTMSMFNMSGILGNALESPLNVDKGITKEPVASLDAEANEARRLAVRKKIEDAIGRL